jgi:hypothetical protein
VHECPRCGAGVEAEFRFCPWCATTLRRKIVEFFPATRALMLDHGKALRVSRYVMDGHVRFSVWSETGIAESAVSISDAEAARLAHFLGSEAVTEELPTPAATRRRGSSSSRR